MAKYYVITCSNCGVTTNKPEKQNSQDYTGFNPYESANTKCPSCKQFVTMNYHLETPSERKLRLLDARLEKRNQEAEEAFQKLHGDAKQ